MEDLKNLKIFLLIFLISIFFIPKVSALTTTHNATLKYSDSFSNTINSNRERINNLRSYIANINCLYNNNYCVNTGNYILVITGSTMSTNSWQVRIVTTNTSNDYIYAWWRTSYSDGRLLMTGNGITYNFNFSGNNVTSHNNRSTGGFNYIDIWNTNGWSGNPMNNDIEIEINNYIDTYFLNENRQINFKAYGQSGFYDIPINLNNVVNIPTIYINAKNLFDSFGESEPSYTYTTEVLDTGSVKLNLEFSNYTEGINYGYEMYNYVSGEYYGITNPFGNYPNIVPYGSSYSITIPFDTSIYIKLYKYENNNRELINQNVIDLNNIVFENPQDPYFKILDQSNNRIRGIFENTESGYSCYYSNSNNNIIGVVICDEEEVNEVFNFNGYVNFYIENQNGNIIYSRKVNVLGADSTPYIIYSVEKQDFYNVIKWEVKNKNLDPNMKYRYSTNNGTSYSEWETIGNEYKDINVYSNTTAIIQISNSDNTTIYDSKAINVIENLNTLKTFNKSSSNLINIFNNMFNVNSNILPKITNLWNNIKNTKAYLIIFIPFISSLIGGIIYLIRRK